jgi:hypothetical protein
MHDLIFKFTKGIVQPEEPVVSFMRMIKPRLWTPVYLTVTCTVKPIVKSISLVVIFFLLWPLLPNYLWEFSPAMSWTRTGHMILERYEYLKYAREVHTVLGWVGSCLAVWVLLCTLRTVVREVRWSYDLAQKREMDRRAETEK